MQNDFNNHKKVNLWLFCVLAVGVGAVELPVARMVLIDPKVSGPAAEDVRLWQRELREPRPGRVDSFERLGWAYVNLGRVSQDAGFFKLAALSADAMDRENGPSSAAKLLRGHAWVQLHHFVGAESLARELVAERGEPRDFALLADATMEQGNLAAAVEACQAFADRQPGLEADVRIAQLRWLHGDLPGAIAAMTRAVRSAGPADSETAWWVRVRLGRLQLLAGDSAAARDWAAAVVRRGPDYAPARLLQGQAAMALGDLDGAVDALGRAAQLNPLPEYLWWQAEALRTAGRPEQAATVESQLLKTGEAADPRTFALFLATRNLDSSRAVRLAEAERRDRSDALTFDTLAWAHLAAGDPTAADAEIRRALATGLNDGRVWLHAGVIAQACGDAEAAAVRFARARALVASLLPSERARLPER